MRCDNGTKFKNTNIEEYLDEEGIGHEFSVPYTPQQNGIVERKNRTLIKAARTMLDEYKISDQFWAEAINTTCHAINRLYLHKILNKMAYELLLGKKALKQAKPILLSSLAKLIKISLYAKYMSMTLYLVLLINLGVRI